jgi:5-methylcytosine-specific restriction endonuclease McrA
MICGRIIDKGSRCPAHAKPPVPRHRQYRNLRQRLIAASPYCYLCGQPFTDPDDPPVLDHVVPRAHGGSSDESNLRPAHRSCNGKKTSTLPAWWDESPTGGRS